MARLTSKRIVLGLDVDDTITAAPEFFALLTKAVRQAGGRVCIVTRRGNLPEVVEATRVELEDYGIEFDEINCIPDKKDEYISCPHEDLDWYEKYLWQKVAICEARNVDVLFDDDPKVVRLFERYAPGIQVFQPV